jgi:hypothetical protein
MNIIKVENRIGILTLVAECTLPKQKSPTWVLNLEKPTAGPTEDFLYLVAAISNRSTDP